MKAEVLTRYLVDEQATIDFGHALAASLYAPMVIYLEGELGAGKTTLVRSCLRSLGYNSLVKSPTYTLVEEYHLSSLSVFHFDLYRIRNEKELFNMGVDEYFRSDSICLIEWPQLINSIAPPDLVIEFKVLEQGRELKLSAFNDVLIKRLKQCLA